MILSILLAILGVTVMSFGYLFQKIGLKEMETLKFIFNTKHGLIWIIGTILTFLGSLLFFVSLGFGDLTVIQPITGLSPAIVTILSVVVFKTTLHKNELYGILTSVFGIVCISYRTVNSYFNYINYFSFCIELCTFT